MIPFPSGNGMPKAQPTPTRRVTDDAIRAVHGQIDKDKWLDLVTIDDVEERVVDWFWHGRIPLGMLTVLAGKGGLGKSMVTVDMAARSSRGIRWPDGADPYGPSDTLFITSEDPVAEVMRPRLRNANADLKRVHIVEGSRYATGRRDVFSLRDDLTLLGDVLDSRPGIRLVVIDPVTSYLPAKVNVNTDHELRSVLVPLVQLAEDRRIALVIVAHERKPIEGAHSVAQRIGGSVALPNLARLVMTIDRRKLDEGGEETMLAVAKCNLCKRAPAIPYEIVEGPQIRWGEPEDIGADEAFQERRKPRAVAKDAAMDWLRTVLEHGPILGTDLEEMAAAKGHAWATVRRARNEIAESFKDDQGRSVWQLR